MVVHKINKREMEGSALVLVDDTLRNDLQMTERIPSSTIQAVEVPFAKGRER